MLAKQKQHCTPLIHYQIISAFPSIKGFRYSTSAEVAAQFHSILVILDKKQIL